jgi:hypothetical protein
MRALLCCDWEHAICEEANHEIRRGDVLGVRVVAIDVWVGQTITSKHYLVYKKDNGERQ